MIKKKIISAVLVGVMSMGILAGCSASSDSAKKEVVKSEEKVVNIYTDRHYDSDEELYKMFTGKTGIKVNVVKGKSDELIERLKREGKDTQADILITADVGRLYRAKNSEVLQPVKSDKLTKNIPEKYRDEDNQWFGLTKRARVIVYSKDKVDPKELSTYEELTNSKWKEKVLVRSSTNIYNQSLLASFIEINGEEKAKEWAKGLVENMAREPQGNDRDQAKAVVAGIGDVAIMNTYYVGKLLNSADKEEVKVGNSVKVFFPNQDTTGTHVNISGAGLTKHAKNKENAVKFIEFLSGTEAQKQYAEANYEYPVNPEVEPSELLKSWGTFKEQDIRLSKLGENNKKAVEILNEVNWK
ncbi:Fe(3+) ABC transporter substrate-binding protein [Clostridium ganghwense]|uniref:Fe(3+) ABC transporter substrate-binding protein n=1 Tax=Clostridium ganghwense TaxID=312089 RepID=A0ABT4CJT6_9CLOT|nr:Fe(3+) ABC transporter substrate-binding protein [Clostridium ganghwense]MCY6369312.1 Fe(3+) ABC transporter substrate-binding protein [Clostridium ganghwense]